MDLETALLTICHLTDDIEDLCFELAYRAGSDKECLAEHKKKLDQVRELNKEARFQYQDIIMSKKGGK